MPRKHTRECVLGFRGHLAAWFTGAGWGVSVLFYVLGFYYSVLLHYHYELYYYDAPLVQQYNLA